MDLNWQLALLRRQCRPDVGNVKGLRTRARLCRVHVGADTFVSVSVAVSVSDSLRPEASRSGAGSRAAAPDADASATISQFN